MGRSILILFFLFPSLASAGGMITGVVKYKGLPPPTLKRPVTIHSDVCGKEVILESLIVNKRNEIKNVVVYLRGPIAGARSLKEPPGRFAIDQKRCRFEPHVSVLAVGAPVRLLNSDRVPHSFHTRGQLNLPINKIRSGGEVVVKFNRPEFFEVRCDIHYWAKGWVVVAEHPYYTVTDERGIFHLTDIPAGDYTLTFWHERLGAKNKRVVLKEGEKKKIQNFSVW